MYNLFNIKDKVVIVTGGYGVLGGSIARYLSTQGARVVILGRNSAKGEELAAEIGGMFVRADVLQTKQLEAARDQIIAKHGTINILINAAGGNMPGAVISPDKTYFDLNMEDMQQVIDLNLMGTVKPTTVFGEVMAKRGEGSIINFSSMSSQLVISRVVGYSAAKAAIDNFTRWTAVEFAKKYGEGLRVNAVAPGFFLTEQNRTLLTNADGSYTPRALDVIHETPFGRMGAADELNGIVHFLSSEASKFVTGTVIPIDGGFSVFSGV